MKCEECHLKVHEKRGIAGARRYEDLKKDPVGLCLDCHSDLVAHHPVVEQVARSLPEALPLSTKGGVICSTCHDVHLKGQTVALLRGFDTRRYSVRMDMCLDCHGETFGGINPHKIDTASEKCYTCHDKAASGEKEGLKKLVSEDLNRTCNFCHNVAAKAHPLNVDPLRKLPDRLPRSRTGEVMCGTCHDPHGTEGTLHFLRKKYVDFLEAGRYINPHGKEDYSSCLGCHNEMSTKGDRMKKNLRYGGEDLQICLSCHGGMDSCHPILVGLSEGMKPGDDLALSPDGKIKCTTCHDPSPLGGSGVQMRGRVEGQPVNAICFRCHDKDALSRRNPHSSMTDRESCRFCHDTMTDPTNDEAARVSFITNTRLICLRCHGQDRHPAGADHMVTPRGVLPESFKLDGRGRITCTTCHNPHIDKAVSVAGEANAHRFVVEGGPASICKYCHRR